MRIEQTQAELARFDVEQHCFEASVAGHRADFEPHLIELALQFRHFVMG